MRADLDVRLLLTPDGAKHVLQLRLDLPAEAGHVLGDIDQLEELLRVNRAAPHVFTVDVHQTAAPDSEARAVVHKSLKGEVEQIHVFNLGARLDLDDVPPVLPDRVEDVHAGEPAVVNKASLEQRFPRLGGLQRLPEHVLEVGHARADLDAAGVE